MGNVFIDLGSMHSLRMAAPESHIQHVSGTPIKLFDRRRYSRKRRFLKKASDSTVGRLIGKEMWHSLKEEHFTLKPSKLLKNLFDLGSCLKSDYAVISGCVLNDYTLRMYSATLSKLKKKNVKIIFNGVGGSGYSKRELSMVKKFLTEIEPYAFISRDEVAFEHYHELAKHSYDGVDCAFFLNDIFEPAEMEVPRYTVLTFDKHREPDMNLDYELVIRVHHKPIYDVPREALESPNIFISDSPEDYFNIYANAESVHTDRVHACVPALSFGTRCKLYYADVMPDIEVRSLLFKRVGLEEIHRNLVQIDTGRIKKEKEKQVRFLRETLKM